MQNVLVGLDRDPIFDTCDNAFWKRTIQRPASLHDQGRVDIRPVRFEVRVHAGERAFHFINYIAMCGNWQAVVMDGFR